MGSRRMVASTRLALRKRSLVSSESFKAASIFAAPRSDSIQVRRRAFVSFGSSVFVIEDFLSHILTDLLRIIWLGWTLSLHGQKIYIRDFTSLNAARQAVIVTSLIVDIMIIPSMSGRRNPSDNKSHKFPKRNCYYRGCLSRQESKPRKLHMKPIMEGMATCTLSSSFHKVLTPVPLDLLEPPWGFEWRDACKKLSPLAHIFERDVCRHIHSSFCTTPFPKHSGKQGLTSTIILEPSRKKCRLVPNLYSGSAYWKKKLSQKARISSLSITVIRTGLPSQPMIRAILAREAQCPTRKRCRLELEIMGCWDCKKGYDGNQAYCQ